MLYFFCVAFFDLCCIEKQSVAFLDSVLQTFFQFVATNERSVAKKKSNVAIKKSALRLYHFVSPLPNPVLRNGLSKPFLRFFLFLLDSRFPVRFDVSTTFPPLWSSSGVYLVFVFDVCNGIKLVESACF